MSFPQTVISAQVDVAASTGNFEVIAARVGARIGITHLTLTFDDEILVSQNVVVEKQGGVDLAIFRFILRTDPVFVLGDGNGIVIANDDFNSRIQFDNNVAILLHINVAWVYLTDP